VGASDGPLLHWACQRSDYPEPRGGQGVRRGAADRLSPDIHYSIDDALQAGDRAAVRWSATATHSGNLFGLAPTRKKVSMIGMTIFRVQDGQIGELRDVWDEAGLMKQLAALA